MPNRIITAQVQGEYIKLSSATAGAAGSHKAVSLEISFDSLWDGTSRKVYFISADGAQNACVTLTTDLLKAGATDVYVVPMPSEGLASAGEMTLTIKGYHVTGTVTDRVVMSASVRMTVLRSDKPAADTEPADVTAAQAEQLQSEIDAIKLTVTDARAAATEAKGSADAAKQSETAASASAASALAAQTAAETARNAAQTAETAAENAQAAAIAAKTTAETKAAEAAVSEANALAYKNAAIAAQQAAETAEAGANAAKTAAQNSETAAGTSVASAAAKATEAADSAANALNSKNAAAAAQTAAEDARDTALSYKAAALASQQAAANAQAAAEAARSAAVTAQTAAEAARDAAQTAKTAAETAQSKAETAQSGAESAKTAAQTAQSLAEAAQTAAQGAATAAQAAQSAAETARTGAQTAETNAGASADEAEAWACGTIGGVAVPSTHPAYNNNSKYYKDQAAAIIGGDFATTADVAAAKNEAISTAAADAKTKADAVQTNLNSHTGNTSNPHSVTKTQVGLGNVDNTADADKPVSTAQQAALDTHNTASDAHSALFAAKLGTAGDASNVTNAFTQASSRANLTTGEKLSVSLGKIMKYFADLGTAAFSAATAFAAAVHTHVKADITDFPTSLKNPSALTFGSKTYDGSAAATVTAADLGAVTDISGKQDVITASGILKGAGSGNVSAAARGTDYSLVNAPVIVSVPYTGWVKNATTNAYEQSVAVAGLLATDDKRTRVEIVGSTDVSAQALIDTAAGLLSYVACNTNGQLYMRCDSGAPATTFSVAVVIAR